MYINSEKPLSSNFLRLTYIIAIKPSTYFSLQKCMFFEILECPRANAKNSNKNCRILKSSFHNRERRIESLTKLSHVFLNCSKTTPLNACTRSTRWGTGGASTKICNSKRDDKFNILETMGTRFARKRGFILNF